MSLQYKPLSLVALATTAVLYGCGGDDAINKTVVYDDNNKTGLWCQNPDIVQVVDADFHPLSSSEINALKAAAMARDGAGFNEAAFNAYSYDFDGIDLFAVLGLTKSELARQAVAKAEARQFKIDQGQQDIFGDGFDAWFDGWFASVPLNDYLGKSERLAKASRGFALSLTSANNNQEICYTPPASCPNYQVPDDSGQYTCITPEDNPLADIQQPVSYSAPTGVAAIFYRHANHVENGDNTEVYRDLTVHTWNDPDCTAYKDDSTTDWGVGKPAAGIDPIYGIYWTMNLADSPDQCGNVIVYNRVTGGKRISEADLRLALGNSGTFVNIDKMSYLQDGIVPNNYDGRLYANQHPLVGAAAGGAKACGWGTALNESGEACVGQSLDNQCPDGTIAVGVGQEQIASKCIELFDPASTTLYLRGGFNDWGTANQLSYVGNQFRLNLNYASHPGGATADEEGTVNHGFKVADADWSDATTFGAIKDGDTPGVGVTAQLTAGNGVGQDMFVKFAENKIYQFVLDVADPAAVKLTVNDVPVAAFPQITLGSADAENFEYSGNGVYFYQTNLEAGTVTVTIADDSSNFALGGAAGASDLVQDQPLALVNGGLPLSFTAANANVYNFILDLSDTDTPSFKVEQAAPLGLLPVFIRGTMTGWGDPAPTEDEIVYNPANRTYSVIYGLEAASGDDKHQFKFASQAWGGPVDLGPDAFTFSTDPDALPLVAGGNIEVQPPKSTSYQFQISYAEGPVGVLKVSEAPIYIRGGIYGSGDWAADETMRLNFIPTNPGKPDEAGHVYSSVVTTSGTGFFKIADFDWGGAYGFNYGAATDGVQVVLGEPLQLIGGGDSKDIGFQHPAGQYLFSFDDVTKQLTVTADTGN